MISAKATDFVRNQVSPATRRAYTYDLNKWTLFLGDRAPTEAIALDFRAYLESKLAPRSAARVFNTCRAFYRWLGGPNPFKNVKSPRRVVNATPKVPSDDLVDAIMALVDNDRDRLVVSLALNGLRRAEIADLRPEDVIWSPEYQCYVLRVIGKGQKERLVPANTETASALRRWQGKTVSEWLLHDIHGHKLTERAVAYVVEKWSKAAGQEIRPHRLRHHYATRLVRSQASVFAIQRLLGHESVATTQIYVGLDLSDIVNEARKDPRDSKQEGLRVVA